MDGALIAFEGLDQSGKQTQAERLRDALMAAGRSVRLIGFPDYTTHIGTEIGLALRGERDTYGPDTMQLLFVANRAEWTPRISADIAAGTVVICDRYLASSIAYGEAQGLDAVWLTEIQRFLVPPALTILLDIAPETAAARKTADRDKYERDLALLARVRASYLRQAAAGVWATVDGARAKDIVAADVASVVRRQLGLL